MTDPHDRLQQARRKRGYSNPTDAARGFGWNINTYRSHENGNASLSRQAAERYSAAYRVSVGWLLTGENPPEWDDRQGEEKGYGMPVRHIPVLTMKQAWSLTHGKKLERIESVREYAVIGVDPMLGKNVFALKVPDEAMSPDFKPGEFIAIDPDASWKPGDYVAAGIDSREGLIIREYRIGGFNMDTGEDKVKLTALNKAYPDIDYAFGETGKIIGKVVWHMRRF